MTKFTIEKVRIVADAVTIANAAGAGQDIAQHIKRTVSLPPSLFFRLVLRG